MTRQTALSSVHQQGQYKFLHRKAPYRPSVRAVHTPAARAPAGSAWMDAGRMAFKTARRRPAAFHGGIRFPAVFGLGACGLAAWRLAVFLPALLLPVLVFPVQPQPAAAIRAAAISTAAISTGTFSPVPPGRAAGYVPPWSWPITPPPAVLRPFKPPPRPWLAGHRGVDLAGPPGTEVRSPAAGTVVFAG